MTCYSNCVTNQQQQTTNVPTQTPKSLLSVVIIYPGLAVMAAGMEVSDTNPEANLIDAVIMLSSSSTATLINSYGPGPSSGGLGAFQLIAALGFLKRLPGNVRKPIKLQGRKTFYSVQLNPVWFYQPMVQI